jgi:hypothetical protein
LILPQNEIDFDLPVDQNNENHLIDGLMVIKKEFNLIPNHDIEKHNNSTTHSTVPLIDTNLISYNNSNTNDSENRKMLLNKNGMI